MQQTQKVPIVLAALLFTLAAVAEIATGRGRIPPDDAAERARCAALVSVDEALARGDAATALRERGERSVDGAVRVAEGFSQLGDREVTERVLRIAASLAVHSHDASAPMRVDTARGRLLESPSSLTRATF